MQTNLVEIAEDALGSARCRCGRGKLRGTHYCLQCTHALPKATRAGLNSAEDEVRATAYQECVAVLEKLFRLKKGTFHELFG